MTLHEVSSRYLHRALNLSKKYPDMGARGVSRTRVMADEQGRTKKLEDDIEQLKVIIEAINNEWKVADEAFLAASNAEDDAKAYDQYKLLMALGSERSYIYEQLWKLMDQLYPISMEPEKPEEPPKGGRHFSRKNNGRNRRPRSRKASAPTRR